MYGIEEASGGKGGLAAQAPAGNIYLGRTLGIVPTASALVSGAPQNGSVLPNNAPINDQVALPVVNADGSIQPTQHPSTLVNNWRQVLDFHNSPTPWILIGILVLYGWVHASVRAGRVASVRVG